MEGMKEGMEVHTEGAEDTEGRMENASCREEMGRAVLTNAFPGRLVRKISVSSVISV